MPSPDENTNWLSNTGESNGMKSTIREEMGEGIKINVRCCKVRSVFVCVCDCSLVVIYVDAYRVYLDASTSGQ